MYTTRSWFVITLAITLLGVAPLQAETDSGTAGAQPWSGYWWQHKTGGLTPPLQKYDLAFQRDAAGWEQSVHVSPSVPDWFGHCHAWSAASLSEKEPRQLRSVQQVSFGIGDQKGLLTACHAQDIANSYGDRFGDGQGNEDFADMRPDEVWRLLQTYVKQQGIPIVMDLEAGEQVWNYPVYQYHVDFYTDGGWIVGTMELVAADNNVDPDYLGTQSSLHTYTFRIQSQQGTLVSGSGEWTGGSVDDHPDFAWYPYVAVAENPELDIESVAQVVGYAVGGENPPPEEDSPENTPPVDLPPPPPETSTTSVSITPINTQTLLSPTQLVSLVANNTSHFVLDVFTDQGDGGRYQAGDPVYIAARSGESGYLYLFDVDPTGDLRLVFPQPGQPNHIEADRTYDLPPKDQPAWLYADSTGQHDVKAIVVSEPLQLTGFSQKPPPQQQQIARQQSGRAKAITPRPSPQPIVVNPAAKSQMQARFIKFFRKAMDDGPAAPEKVSRFAQDACVYFVLPSSSTTNQQQDN